MMRSLFSAVSGLKAHQTRMDVIGNNIANVNTVAYKSQNMTFSDVYYQTTQTATGPNADSGKGGTNAKQIGLGSSVGSISTAISTPGAPERTDNPWDLCISGDAFFVVNSAGNTYFTRSGDFKTDLDGALVTQGGAHVMGWKIDADGAIVKDKVQPVYVKSPEYMYTPPAETTAVNITGNVDERSKSDSVFTINFYDSLGNEYQAALTLSYVEPGAGGTADDRSSYQITDSMVTVNGRPTTLSVTTDQYIEFNKNSGISMESNANITLTITDTDPDNSGIVMENIGVPGADGTSTITMDASKLTMFADATDIKGYTGIGGKGAGKAVGKMTSVGISEAGEIVANYSNGDTKTIGQIAITTFANPAGLEKVGENLYAATLNSGLFDGIGQDITETGGKMSSGYLEMSNVDLGNEFITMITTQRGFQANSRIITVSDTMLEELINLKR